MYDHKWFQNDNKVSIAAVGGHLALLLGLVYFLRGEPIDEDKIVAYFILN